MTGDTYKIKIGGVIADPYRINHQHLVAEQPDAGHLKRPGGKIFVSVEI